MIGKSSGTTNEVPGSPQLAGFLPMTLDAADTKSIQLIRLDEDWQKIAQQPDSAPLCQACPENLAYLIYTSGSTGKPKSVLGHHRGIVNRLHWDVGQGTAEVYAQKTTLNFIDAIWEVFMPLIRGGRTVLVPDAAARDPDKLAIELSQHQVTRLVLVPSLLRALLNSVNEKNLRLHALRHLASSGEPLPSDLAELTVRTLPGVDVLNIYGTSEFWDASSYSGRAPPALDWVPLGRPIGNMVVYVLDRSLHPVPIGVSGELCVGGVGLARGYFGRSGLTAECFVPSPFGEGARLYRTGDLARWRGDGNLEYLGRLDHQVKVRGFRIELGEIEAALRSHAGIKDTVVVAREEGSGEKRLVAYVVLSGEGVGLDGSAVRAHLKRSLPDYMVPSAVVELAKLPLTPNGKVDRQALPAPEGRPCGMEYVAPRNPAEELLCGIWAEVLRVERVGIYDNFFELGGHSLLLIQLHSKIEKHLGISLPKIMLFQYRNINDLVNGISGRPDHEPLFKPAYVRAKRRLSWVDAKRSTTERHERTVR
jgi:amino acid adenylation domain-containing protein